jgi:hypothetical protein
MAASASGIWRTVEVSLELTPCVMRASFGSLTVSLYQNQPDVSLTVGSVGMGWSFFARVHVAVLAGRSPKHFIACRCSENGTSAEPIRVLFLEQKRGAAKSPQ